MDFFDFACKEILIVEVEKKILIPCTSIFIEQLHAESSQGSKNKYLHMFILQTGGGSLQ
ncbi:hypothetical protein FCV25MIE_26580, partial [Fagus crenata]